MRFTSITALIALAASVSAYVIPTGTQDGVYEISVGDDGKEIHTKIADIPVAAARSIEDREVSPANVLEELSKRNNAQIWCGCGFNMNHGDCDGAVNALKAQLGNLSNPIKPRLAFYSIRGGVVAFACNRNPSRNWTIWPDQYGGELARITSSCGWYVAGTSQFGDNGQELVMGYMNYFNGLDFCAASTGSPANHC